MNSSTTEEPVQKKPKLNDTAQTQRESDSNSSQDGPLLPFHQFSMDKVLFTDPTLKSMAVCGTFEGSNNVAVVVAEKQPLERSTISQLFGTSDSDVVRNTHNDIYSQYVVKCGGDLGTCKLTTVYPATDKHVKKYSRQTYHLVHETPEQYREVIKPFIAQQAFSLKVCVFATAILSALMFLNLYFSGCTTF